MLEFTIPFIYSFHRLYFILSEESDYISDRSQICYNKITFLFITYILKLFLSI